MGVATKSRRVVFTTLKGLLSGVSGSTYQDRIDIKAGPQGRAASYFDLGPFSDEALPEWRGQSGSKVGQTYDTVATFAFRYKPHAREESRLAARDVIDDVQEALAVGLSGGSPTNIEFTFRGCTESVNAESEWLFFACRVRARCLFDLTA